MSSVIPEVYWDSAFLLCLACLVLCTIQCPFFG